MGPGCQPPWLGGARVAQGWVSPPLPPPSKDVTELFLPPLCCCWAFTGAPGTCHGVRERSQQHCAHHLRQGLVAGAGDRGWGTRAGGQELGDRGWGAGDGDRGWRAESGGQDLGTGAGWPGAGGQDLGTGAGGQELGDGLGDRGWVVGARGQGLGAGAGWPGAGWLDVGTGAGDRGWGTRGIPSIPLTIGVRQQRVPDCHQLCPCCPQLCLALHVWEGQGRAVGQPYARAARGLLLAPGSRQASLGPPTAALT